MEKTVVVYCDTAMFKDGPQTRTKLTLDYTNLTDDEVRYYADDACIIKVQNSWRRKKDSTIPAEATYKVPKPGTKAGAVMLSLDALVMICGGNKELALSIVNKAGSVEAALALFKEVLAEYEAEG